MVQLLTKADPTNFIFKSGKIRSVIGDMWSLVSSNGVTGVSR